MVIWLYYMIIRKTVVTFHFEGKSMKNSRYR